MGDSRLGCFEPLLDPTQNTFDITPYKVQAPLSFFLSSQSRLLSATEACYITFAYRCRIIPTFEAPLWLRSYYTYGHTCKRAAFPCTSMTICPHTASKSAAFSI